MDYKVFIFGVQDNRDSRPSNKLPDGSNVIRVNIKKTKALYVSFISFLKWFLSALFFIMILITFYSKFFRNKD